jgi:hypothetical protein
MKYRELPVGYRIELDMLESQARERIDSGMLRDQAERVRRYDLLTSDVGKATAQSEHRSLWERIVLEECYLVTTIPKRTNGVVHDEIIFREFFDLSFKRILPVREGGRLHTRRLSN